MIMRLEIHDVIHTICLVTHCAPFVSVCVCVYVRVRK